MWSHAHCQAPYSALSVGEGGNQGVRSGFRQNTWKGLCVYILYTILLLSIYLLDFKLSELLIKLLRQILHVGVGTEWWGEAHLNSIKVLHTRTGRVAIIVRPSAWSLSALPASGLYRPSRPGCCCAVSTALGTCSILKPRSFHSWAPSCAVQVVRCTPSFNHT